MQTFIPVFNFQCKNLLNFFGEKVLNSKLLLFGFIQQTLFKLLPKVKNCGGGPCTPSVVEVSC